MCFRPATAAMPKKCPSCQTICQPHLKTCPKCGADLSNAPSATGGAPGAPKPPGAPGAPKPPGVPKPPGES